MSEDDVPIHGTPEEVIRYLMSRVAEGRMDAEQATELVAGMVNDGGHTHDVSVAFRSVLIALGHEDVAMRLHEVMMGLGSAGAVFRYKLAQNDEAEWVDQPTSEVGQAVLRASICVLRAGFLDASPAEDGIGVLIQGNLGPAKHNHGVAPDDVEKIVSEFMEEVDQEFPDVPKPREGKWW